jgi:hypothetical protein
VLIDSREQVQEERAMCAVLGAKKVLFPYQSARGRHNAKLGNDYRKKVLIHAI